MNLLYKSSQEAIAESSSYPSYKLIVVIGESYSKRHSSLYGYPLMTTPEMNKWLEKGNLVTFNDAITRIPATSNNMMEIFSTWSYGDSLRWESYPLVPVLLRNARYKTTMLDNQTTASEPDFLSGMGSAFYSTIGMSSLCFDYRNEKRYAFDYDMVKDNISKLDSADIAFVHLMGQHIDARERFPNEFAKFNVDSYSFRSDLSDAQKKVVAAYDNATLYNDFVLGKLFDYFSAKDVIVIYLSDHGEEIFDFREVYGRRQEPVTLDILPYLYDIPYVIWMSDEFKVEHPELEEKIKKAKNYPIINSDISHVVLDLMNIETSTFKPGHSYLNSQYDTIAKRKLMSNNKFYEDMRSKE